MHAHAQRAPQTECPTLPKNERDVRELKRFARFVIEINKDGSVSVTNNQRLVIAGRRYVPIIAVVANLDEEGRRKASVLELCYKRARPYRRIHKNRNKILMQRRQSRHQLTEEQFVLVYPHILSCLRTVLIETRMRWKSTEPWIVNGRAFEKGVQFTVSKADELLYQAMLIESLRYFDVALLSDWTHWINWKLQEYKYTSYPDGFYRCRIRKVVESIMASRFLDNPFWLEALLHRVEKGTLLRNALFHLHEHYVVPTAEVDLAFNRSAPKVPEATNLFIWHTTDQPSNQRGTHAAGCARFEVLFDRRDPLHRPKETGGFKQVIYPKEYDDEPDFVPF